MLCHGTAVLAVSSWSQRATIECPLAHLECPHAHRPASQMRVALKSFQKKPRCPPSICVLIPRPHLVAVSSMSTLHERTGTPPSFHCDSTINHKTISPAKLLARNTFNAKYMASEVPFFLGRQYLNRTNGRLPSWTTLLMPIAKRLSSDG